MGIDAKETGAILWKILGFSMSTSIKFMRNHPIFSSVSMFLLALYIFLPSVLFFLIYTSPITACVVVYAREKLGLGSFFGKVCGPCGGGGEKKCHLRQQRSVRRNARMKVEEWDSSHTSEEEDDKVILTSLYNDLLGRTPHFEESPKAIETVIEEEEEKKGEDLGVSSCELNVEKPSNICNCEIKEGKEESKDEMSNVNEYGISEIERNMRLESLIARRRARRLFRRALDQRHKLQGEETTNNLQITVPRNKNNNRNFSSDGTVMGLQVPGSAPSVMSQGRNPFDIPYDPQEERPILTGDSFDQEFSLFSKKDMFFCRHESFCRFALFSPEPSQCLNSPASTSEIATTRKRLDFENEYIDHTEKKLPCDESKETTIEEDERRVESGKTREREETDSNPEEGDDESSGSDESESELSRLNKAELREAICHSMDNYPGYLVNQTRSSIPNPLPRAAVAPKLDDNEVLYARRCANAHSRTFSVASDMQVEVSEIGSPPTTVDWLDDWSNGGESYTYDTDIDKEIVRSEESRSGVGFKPDQEHIVDEQLRELDDRKSQAGEDITELVDEEVFEQNPSRDGEVYKRSNSGKFDGFLFHTSVSLSSITEEPETAACSIISENMNYLEKLNDEEVFVKHNDDVCGSPKMIDLHIINHVQRDDDPKIDMKECENTTQSLMDASLETPYTKISEREMKEEDELNLEKFIEEETKQPETVSLQSDFTELLESEVVKENGPTLVEKVDEKEEPIEQEKSQILLEDSSSHPHTYLSEDCIDTDNVINVSLLQGSSSTLDESTDQVISKEIEDLELVKHLYVELIQENNNKTNVEEASVVSTGIEYSQDSQQFYTNSPKGTSPRILETTQQQEHEDVISPNTVFQDISKDDSVALPDDSASRENNGEENMNHNYQVGEAMENKSELDVEPLHHSIDLVTREDDEESMKDVKAMHVEETETIKDESRVSDYVSED